MQKQRSWKYPTSDEAIPEWYLPDGALPSELVHLLIQRGIDQVQAAGFLSPKYYASTEPTALPDLGKAVEIISQLNEGRILIWTDYDLDGITAALLLREGLSTSKHKLAIHFSKQRQITIEDLRRVIGQYHPNLIIWSDLGSTATAAIDDAHQQNIRTLILDHHAIRSDQMPTPDAFVNPMRLSDTTHPLYNLSAVGIVYLFVQAYFQNQIYQRDKLDVVVLGLLADNMPLIRDTRYWVQLGLEAFRHSERTGIQALCNQLEITQSLITEKDLQFTLIPALNALGRMDSPEKAMELLATRDKTTAQLLAARAHGLSQQRRLLIRQQCEAAYQQIENDSTLLQWEALVLISPAWEGTVLGTVASRLAEEYQKPTALLLAREGENVSASVRGIRGYSVIRALDQIQDLLLSYGGHHPAGGFTALEANLPLLRRRLSQGFEATKNPTEIGDESLEIAGILPLERLHTEFAYQVRRLAPFGEGNPAPTFVSTHLTLRSSAKLGANDEHRRLTMRDKHGIQQTFFHWNSADLPMLEGELDLAYAVDVSQYKGETEIQLTVVDWQQRQAPLHKEKVRPIVYDYRSTTDLKSVLEEIRHKAPNCQIWAEGFSATQSLGLPLSQLAPAETLVILIAPPSPERLETAITIVSPNEVYLIASLPPIQTLDDFLEKLAGLCQIIIDKQAGDTTATQLMERLATSEQVLQLGLTYLHQQGKFLIAAKRGGKIKVATATATIYGETDKIYQQLQKAWAETEAYRRYLRRVGVEYLFIE